MARQRTMKRPALSREQAQCFLGNVPDDKVFWSADGRVFHNIGELANALTNMSEETFAQHLNAGKNDFSKWVRDVLGDEELAMALDKASDRASAIRATADRLIILQRAS